MTIRSGYHPDAQTRAIGFVVMPGHVQLLGDTRVSELITRFKWNAGELIRERRGARIPT